jgi:hypothetical protein
MYEVNYTERFEDWYVSDYQLTCHETINNACSDLNQVIQRLLSNPIELQGLRMYIKEHHQGDEEIDSYSIGVLLTIKRDSEQIASLDLVFDPHLETLVCESYLVLDYENLAPCEQKALRKLATQCQSYLQNSR